MNLFNNLFPASLFQHERHMFIMVESLTTSVSLYLLKKFSTYRCREDSRIRLVLMAWRSNFAQSWQGYADFIILKRRVEFWERWKIICELFHSVYVSVKEYHRGKKKFAEKNGSSNALIFEIWQVTANIVDHSFHMPHVCVVLYTHFCVQCMYTPISLCLHDQL